MSNEILLRHDTDAIASLTLNAPASFNALSTAMLTALQTEIARLHADPSIRVVILKGAGKAFCAGHDLREMQAARTAPDQGRDAFETLFALLYGFLHEGRWPSTLEGAAIVLLLAGVLWSVSLHRPGPQAHPAT